MLSYLCPCFPPIFQNWRQTPISKTDAVPTENTAIKTATASATSTPISQHYGVLKESVTSRTDSYDLTEEPTFPTARNHLLLQKRQSTGTESSADEYLVKQSVQKHSSTDSEQRRSSGHTKIGEIRPDLYMKKFVMSQPVPSKDLNLGTLFFRIFYDFKKSDFVVTLLEANLMAADIVSSAAEIFVTVQLRPEVDHKRRKTAVQKGHSPVFNEVFKFPATIDELSYRNLRFDVWNCQPRNKQYLIGSVDFDLTGLDISAELEITADVERRQEPIDLGKIQVSVNYLAVAERLTVAVIEGRDLKGQDTHENSDPYVYVYVLHDGKRLKKKHTSVKKSDSNPKWNEPLSFLVPQKILKDLTVQLLVMDRDAGANSAPIGEVVLGTKAPTKEGRCQWHEIVEGKSGTPYWHKMAQITSSD